jgi:hypothetical protein
MGKPVEKVHLEDREEDRKLILRYIHGDML